MLRNADLPRDSKTLRRLLGDVKLQGHHVETETKISDMVDWLDDVGAYVELVIGYLMTMTRRAASHHISLGRVHLQMVRRHPGGDIGDTVIK